MTRRQWDADVDLDLDHARRLIADAFPELAHESTRVIGSGWDNLVVGVGEELAFRMPRRALGHEIEQRAMPVLTAIAGRLPLPIPRPTHAGAPRLGYPYHFWGVRFVPGTPADQRILDDDAQRRIAESLAAFLRTLHALDVPDLPSDTIRKSDVAYRLPGLHRKLGHLVDQELMTAEDASSFHDLGAHLAGRSGDPRGQGVLVHCDLYPRHLMLDEHDDLCGIIDWGDVCRSDRASDLRVLWLMFDAPARDVFLEWYGDVDDATMHRARFLALYFSAMVLEYGHVQKDEAMSRMASDGLRRIHGGRESRT